VFFFFFLRKHFFIKVFVYTLLTSNFLRMDQKAKQSMTVVREKDGKYELKFQILQCRREMIRNIGVGWVVRIDGSNPHL